MKNVTAGANPMDIKRGIQKAVNTAVEAVKAHSQNVNGSKAVSYTHLTQLWVRYKTRKAAPAPKTA